MKILHVTHSYWPATFFGGPIFSTLGLCEGLSSLPGVKLRVVSTDAAGPTLSDRICVDEFPTLYPPGYEVYFIKQSRQYFAPWQLSEILYQMRWADYVLLTGTYSFHVLPTLIFARVFRKPLAWSPRGALLDSYRWREHRRPILKRLYEKVCQIVVGPLTRFVVTSEDELIASVARINGVPASIVSNGIRLPTSLPPRKWRPDGCLRLMSIGRIHPKKGLENIISAMLLLGRHISLDIYGRGEADYEKSLRRLATNLGVRDRVHFHKHVDGVNKTEAFLHCDIFVLPSHSENFGMVVAEALAHGLPAIVSNRAPWSRITTMGAGLWVENVPESLANAVIQLADSNLQLMGQQGRDWMSKEFSWDAKAKEMISVFNELNAIKSHEPKNSQRRDVAE